MVKFDGGKVHAREGATSTLPSLSAASSPVSRTQPTCFFKNLCEGPHGGNIAASRHGWISGLIGHADPDLLVMQVTQAIQAMLEEMWPSTTIKTRNRALAIPRHPSPSLAIPRHPSPSLAISHPLTLAISPTPPPLRANTRYPACHMHLPAP
jgi:hypothetical protein